MKSSINRCQFFGRQLPRAIVNGLLALAWIASLGLTSASAKSPVVVMQGRALFERSWTPTSTHQGDGLGPLFNGQSCVACHHQGGVGGGGDARFNAKTIAFDWLKITGPAANFEESERVMRRNSEAAKASGAPTGALVLPPEAGIFSTNPNRGRGTKIPPRVAQAVAEIHPGFVSPAGAIVSSFTISHHGGTERFAVIRQTLLDRIPAVFSPHGGPISASEVRLANATTLPCAMPLSDGTVTIRARLYQRNTPPLFGAGLIDRVTAKDVEAIVRRQRRHPEISGRPEGRFGWRANVVNLLDFCEQACANELGLSTTRARQPADPTNPSYQNLQPDISDAMIHSMAAFVASLPAPEREIPSTVEERQFVQRGEAAFARVGCGVCHVADVGPATGIYSDLLLHDMGRELIDLNPAVPAVRNTVIKTARRNTPSSLVPRRQSPASDVASKLPEEAANVALMLRAYRVQSMQRRERELPPPLPSGYYGGGITLSAMKKVGPGEYAVGPELGRDRSGHATNVTQEWRTPPLWGVRDSAPYLHDGRAETILEAIMMHEGEAAGTRDRFLNLPLSDRTAILAFLNTMVAPKNAPAN